MRTIGLFALLLVSFQVQSQVTVNVVAVANPIPPAIYQQLDAIMGGEGPIQSVRLYAEFPEGLQLSAIYGSSAENTIFNIQSGNTFYQHPAGAATGLELVDNGADPLLAYDSWFTIGAANATEAEAYSAQLALETTPFFENFELGYDVEVDTAALLLNEAGVFVFNGFDEFGNSTALINQPDANGRVLIGQFTTRQFVQGCFTFSLDDTVVGQIAQYQIETCFSFSPSFVIPDFNEDGFVNMEDLNLIMADFGCINGCNSDLTGDGMVTVDDLISFIYYYNYYLGPQ
ncbi:MAG: hypothetical protein K1X54_08280 [Flavobacteriales bacterium]|nr:hypothetical protein [Flavobacteriales bacterium]